LDVPVEFLIFAGRIPRKWEDADDGDFPQRACVFSTVKNLSMTFDHKGSAAQRAPLNGIRVKLRRGWPKRVFCFLRDARIGNSFDLDG
jgi:hypothetical protein